MARSRVLAVVHFAKKRRQFAIRPFAVRGKGKITSFTGIPVERCVVLTAAEWIRDGLCTTLALLKQAPFEHDAPIEGLSTAASEDWFPPIERRGVGYARAMGWVTRIDGGPPTLSRVEVYPARSSFVSGEVFRFTKLPTSAVFIAELGRLMDPKRRPGS